MHKRTIPIIHIIGLPGAGKTTLARRLSKVLKAPVFCIGYYRARFPQTALGEADTWVTLFRELSRRGWKNSILRNYGIKFHGGFSESSIAF